MKSFNHLFEQLISTENLDKAIENSSKRKRDRAQVQKVLLHKDAYIKALQKKLINNSLRIRLHHTIKINDGIKAKTRLIIRPDYIYEQIIHHALAQVLTPIFMRSMYQFSCGSLPGRGGLYGKRYLSKYIREHPKKIKYVAKGDISKFFKSVNIDIVKSKLRRIIHDERFLNILFQVIDSNKAIYQGETVDMGLPIGYYISQWLANWFLKDLDHFVKQDLKIKCYVRYVDDFVLLSSNKRHLHKCLAEISKFLETQDLKIKPNYQVYRFIYIDKKKDKEKGRVIDFMGYKFYRDRTVLRRGVLLRATRKARKIAKKDVMNWYECTQILCYLGWFKYTDTYGIFKKYIKSRVNIRDCKKVVSLRQKRINKRLTKNGINMAKIRKFNSTACG